VKDISDRLERILKWEGEDPVVVVHVGKNNMGKTRKEDLFGDYQALGAKLENRSSIPGLLPEPHAKSLRKLGKLTFG